MKKKIEDIVAQVRDVERKLARVETLDAELTAKFAFSCTEIACWLLWLQMNWMEKEKSGTGCCSVRFPLP